MNQRKTGIMKSTVSAFQATTSKEVQISAKDVKPGKDMVVSKFKKKAQTLRASRTQEFKKKQDEEQQQQLVTNNKLGVPGKNEQHQQQQENIATTPTSKDQGAAVVHYYTWYKTSTLTAFLNANQNLAQNVQKIDLTKTIDAVFGEHKYRKAYESLLLQMFGQKFEAQKLVGGFSGSVVLRVQPYDLDGTPEEQVIVKLDEAATVREEVVNSHFVYEVLADRAAKVLGELKFCCYYFLLFCCWFFLLLFWLEKKL